MTQRTAIALIALIVFSTRVQAQAQTAPPARATIAGVTIDGASPPVPPVVATRDEQKRVTLRATRLTQPLAFDGRMNDEVYATVPGVEDFIQQDPHEGAPASRRSEVWVFFDERAVYIAARFWTPPEHIISNEMRRDHGNVFRISDSITVILDTFYDRRSAYFIQSNPQGAVRDGLLPDEIRNVALDFDLVWDVRSAVFDQGWSTEMMVPFKSLRYPPRRDQVWGFNIQRMERRLNEATFLNPVPISYGGAGIFKVSSAGTLVGIEAPAAGGILDVEPYTISSRSENRSAGTRATDLDADFGMDAKYKINKSLNVDFTYNTDFAQVEVDTQQLNLTRFNLFFPEKREFFLEGQANFNFGFNFGSALSLQPTGDAPIIFFSRQIGLLNGQTVPIAAGARLIGRTGPFAVGAMSIRTKESGAGASNGTTFSIVRLRRDVLRRSAIGMIATDRRPGLSGDSNQVIGVDASFRFFQNLEFNSFYTRSRTPSATGNEAAYSGNARYAGDLYGAEIGRSMVGEAFNPELGFLTRRAYNRTYGFLRFSRRPQHVLGMRKVDWEGALDDFTGTDDVRQTRLASGTFRMSSNTGDQYSAVYSLTDDRPQRAFAVAGAPIQPGSYSFHDLRINYLPGAQRPVVGTISFAEGQYYGGRKTEASFNGRVALTTQLGIEPIVTLTWLRMPGGRYQAQVVSTRTTYTLTPRMQVSALVQYNSTARSLSTNARYRWEYRPGSDFYIVYTDGRDTLLRGFPDLLSRSVSLKFTRLFQI